MRKGSRKTKKAKVKKKMEGEFQLPPAFTFCLFAYALSSDSPFDGIIRIRFKGSPYKDSQPRSFEAKLPRKIINYFSRYSLSITGINHQPLLSIPARQVLRQPVLRDRRPAESQGCQSDKL